VWVAGQEGSFWFAAIRDRRLDATLDEVADDIAAAWAEAAEEPLAVDLSLH
jgi:hypothetical protein